MQRIMTRSKAMIGIALAGLLAVTAAGCAGGDDGSNGSEGGGDAASTFVYAASADPITLDGAYVSDGESLRPIRQIFDTLVTTKPGTTTLAPQLAKSWKPDASSKVWTFNLEEGVKFTDGTALDADAVCANFERWFGFKSPAQQTAAYYWATVFTSFKDKAKDSLFKSCEATDATTVVVSLTKGSASFISAMTMPSFSIASPTALEKYKADEVGGSPEQPQFKGTFGNKNPIGSGPFMLESWNRGDKLTLVRNDDYWGKKASLEKVIVRSIPDGTARRQALESGEIDGYDNAAPGDIQPLKDKGFQLLERPAFNVAYVGFQQEKKPFDDPLVRQAVAHALNKKALLKAKYPPGAQEAKEFVPPTLNGFADDVPTYDYDPAKAKQLLKQSGDPNPTVEFWYPTNVSRPYMPDPQANFQAFKRDLEAVGFKVKPKSMPWDSGYTTTLQAGRAPMYLLGWNGDFGDADNFIGTFFQGDQPQFGVKKSSKMTELLNAAETETDPAKRTEIYKDANREIMKNVPGVPYVNVVGSIPLDKKVKGYVPDPLTNERFNTITIEE
ncbi:MAG: ABC transporter substrate-binding protein [Streptosporangiales bacterium]|nr:ABC transporter substrate-binding protein [Streptosporangiales bacterium]